VNLLHGALLVDRRNNKLIGASYRGQDK
jgi:hypothetical protein